MKRIFLIGYMGAGKSSVGIPLANRMQLNFIDLDVYIEAHLRRSIRQLFQEKGEDAFRLIEQSFLHQVADFENIVIATGGGTPCFFDNINFMNNNGLTVYLNVSPYELFKRLRIASHLRPLLFQQPLHNLQHFIAQQLAQREPFYQQANITISAEHIATPPDIQLLIDRLLPLL